MAGEYPKKNQSLDRRIQNAQCVEEMMGTKGWTLYIAEIEKLRNVAHYHVLALNDDKWRGRLIAMDEVMGIHEDFLNKRDEANMEKEFEGQFETKEELNV